MDGSGCGFVSRRACSRKYLTINSRLDNIVYYDIVSYMKEVLWGQSCSFGSCAGSSGIVWRIGPPLVEVRAKKDAFVHDWVKNGSVADVTFYLCATLSLFGPVAFRGRVSRDWSATFHSFHPSQGRATARAWCSLPPGAEARIALVAQATIRTVGNGRVEYVVITTPMRSASNEIKIGAFLPDVEQHSKRRYVSAFRGWQPEEELRGCQTDEHWHPRRGSNSGFLGNWPLTSLTKGGPHSLADVELTRGRLERRGGELKDFIIFAFARACVYLGGIFIGQKLPKRCAQHVAAPIRRSRGKTVKVSITRRMTLFWVGIFSHIGAPAFGQRAEPLEDRGCNPQLVWKRIFRLGFIRPNGFSVDEGRANFVGSRPD